MSHTVEINGKTAKIFLEKNEIENETLKQVKAMIKEDSIENARIMPDCHKSKNCCVGFTSKLVDKIVPNYVGNDIGCGITTYPIELSKPVSSMREKQIHKLVNKIDTDIAVHTSNWKAVLKEPCFENFRENVLRIFMLANKEVKNFQVFYEQKFNRDISCKIPEYNNEWLSHFLKKTGLSNTEFYGSLMTLGNGNHFIEFNKSEKDNQEYVTVHSGSRIVGKKICDYHQKKIYSSDDEKKWEEFDEKVRLFNKSNKNKKDRLEYRNKLRNEMKNEKQKKKYLDEDEAIDYYIDMIFGQKYAIVNRELMITYVLNLLSEELEFEPEKKIESVHNYIDFSDFVMRKGAISSRKDELCLIALNMAEGILLCRGKGNEDWNFSCAHGAGRQITREKAIKSKIPMEKRLRKLLEEKEVYSSSETMLGLLVDESPECYKESSLIIERIEPAIEIIDHLKPFINIKNAFVGK